MKTVYPFCLHIHKKRPSGRFREAPPLGWTPGGAYGPQRPLRTVRSRAVEGLVT